jgi:hypothetical protein
MVVSVCHSSPTIRRSPGSRRISMISGSGTTVA